MTCLTITGPTASGKSDLALALAEKLDGEIVCMDSMQIYRGMDIGTAKPSPEEQARVPHHMLDVAGPMDSFSVTRYKEMAYSCAHDILKRGHLPVFCGGTGFYLRALRSDMAMGGAAGDPQVRSRLEKEAAEMGQEAMHAHLMQLDPETAARLHPNDIRRVIRALEVMEITGIPFSRQQNSMERDRTFTWRVICLDMDRETLYRRINLRVDRMIESGLEAEVKGLLDMGVSASCQSMQGIGYKEWIPYFSGQEGESVDTVAEAIRLNTRHYAKRQLTWMRREEEVLWLNALSPDTLRRATEYILKETK